MDESKHAFFCSRSCNFSELYLRQAWSEMGWGAKVVHAFQDCGEHVPLFLPTLGPHSICYVVESDYRGDGMVPVNYNAFISDGFHKGGLTPEDVTTLGCDKKAALCSRYRIDSQVGTLAAERSTLCTGCFESLGGSDPACKSQIESACGVVASDGPGDDYEL